MNDPKGINDVYGYVEGDRLQKVVGTSSWGEDILTNWRERMNSGTSCPILWRGSAKIITRPVKKTSVQKKVNLPISVSMRYSVKENDTHKLMEAPKEAEDIVRRNKFLEEKCSRNAIVSRLLAALYAKDKDTEAHSQRLVHLCRAMAEPMKLSTAESNDLLLLAVLHDIGKIGIQERILQKPGPLTEEESAQVRRHCYIGSQITQCIPELSGVADYILLHHERWDGRGYPQGYKGEEIPLLCRILAVADAYDVMIHGRVYQLCCTHDDAVCELRRNAGTQFDPEIVELFIQVVDESLIALDS